MSETFSEKRKFGRRAVFKPAIFITEGGEKIEGVVIDISDGGARFKTPQVDRISKRGVLQIPGDDFTVDCEVVHVFADTVGVRYVASPKKLSWRPTGSRRFLKALADR
jgi:PilZ domain